MPYFILRSLIAFLAAAASGWLMATSLGLLTSISGLLVLFVSVALFVPASLACLAILTGASLGKVLAHVHDIFWEVTLVAAFFFLAALFVFVEIRHVSLRRRRTKHPITYATHLRRQRNEVQKRSEEHPLYVLAVLGSGGHTKEMLLMMESGFRQSRHSYRRYVVSSGDNMSLKHLEAFEKTLRETMENPGTYDVHVVTRARRVHQSLLSTPISALRSVLDIFPILLSRPKQTAPGSPVDLPDVIFTNGPATGFFVGLVAHMLKIFCLVADSKMQVLFIESWARVSTLSLTGKLFHYTGIADTFLVQHDAVADGYGVLNAGWLVLPPSRRSGRVVQ